MASRQPRTSFAKKASEFDRLRNLIGGSQLAPDLPKRSGGIATLAVESIIEMLLQSLLVLRRFEVAPAVSAGVQELDELGHKAGGESCVGDF